MPLRRAIPTIFVILMALAASGCSLPGLGGGGASRPGGTGVAGGPGAPDGTGGPDDFSAFSPEVSMQRDLLQLREREAGQRETVENMRLALRQGSEDMRREEERLQDIQLQIERYDSAMRRYEMAGRYALPADGRGGEAGTLPVRYSPAGRGDGYGAAGGINRGNGSNGYGVSGEFAQSPRFQSESEGGQRGREGDFSQSARQPVAGRGQGMAPARGGEEVLYAGAYDPRLAEQPAPVGDLTLRRAAGRAPARSRPQFEDEAPQGDFFAAPDSGAFAARAPAADDVWNRPSAARPGAEQLAVAPARTKQPVPSRTGPGGTPPAPEARTVEARPAAPEDDGLDEVFTPDLFLSRR